MLHAFKGRINRKTFLLGNIIGLCLLGFAALIYIVPLALIDIVVNNLAVSSILRFFYLLFAIPGIFYFFYFSVLFVRRMHDIGYPGMLLLWIFIFFQAASALFDIYGLNILGFLIVIIVSLFPGQKERNTFGPKPHKKFKLSDLAIKL